MRVHRASSEHRYSDGSVMEEVSQTVRPLRLYRHYISVIMQSRMQYKKSFFLSSAVSPWKERRAGVRVPAPAGNALSGTQLPAVEVRRAALQVQRVIRDISGQAAGGKKCKGTHQRKMSAESDQRKRCRRQLTGNAPENKIDKGYN